MLLAAQNSNAKVAAIALARMLKASILITTGPDALLPRLQLVQQQAQAAGCEESSTLLALALEAAQKWQQGGVTDIDLANVAAVVCGLFPA